MSPRKNTPDQESEKTDSATAVAEPAAMEGGENGHGFAERVGQKTYAPVPDPFGIATDYLAGVRLMESRRDRTWRSVRRGTCRGQAEPGRHRHGEGGGLPLEPVRADMDAPRTLRDGHDHAHRGRAALPGRYATRSARRKASTSEKMPF